MSILKTITGVLAGAAVGAAIGILFAPSKGSVTRRKFTRQNFDLTDELEDKFDALIDKITEQFNAVVEEVNQMAKDGELKAEKAETS